MEILVVENQPELAQSFELKLKSEGYQVMVCNDGMAGLAAAKTQKPDLILLDASLPKLSGLEICRQLRSLGERVPLILLINRDEISDRVAALDAGADDYLALPFSMEELLARLKVHLHAHTPEDSRKLTFLDLSLNRDSRTVQRGDRQIELTATEYDLLEYLLSHPRQVLTRAEILEQVWGSDFTGDSNIIEVYIRYLRLKLEANHEKRLIQTVRGVGYVLKE